jgi:sugar phosphate isomerase/epimerase
MDIVCSPKGIINIENPGRGVVAMAHAGFKNAVLDFGMYRDGRALENMGRSLGQGRGNQEGMGAKNDQGQEAGYDKLIERACAEMEKNCIGVSVATTPGLGMKGKHAFSNEFLLQLTEKCIRTCGKIGCPYLVVPAFPIRGTSGERMGLPAFPMAGTSGGDFQIRAACYRRLAAVAVENGVTLLLKNECGDLNGHLVRGEFCDAKEAAEFLDLLNTRRPGGVKVDFPVFGFCLDVGVCNICGQNMYDFVHGLGKNLKAVVLRDNDGRADASFLPFTNVGTLGARTDWRGLICGLREIDFDGLAVLCFADSFCVAPGVLRAKYLEFAKSMGEYFKWQVGQRRVLAKYESRVLFGAGNMCRNYMQHYGGEFPPLFTCDNDKRSWNREFEGLMVKKPEELKKLPKDCAIFICNIYYEEIAGQLREMGLENPIEYFNDEYLPFERDWPGKGRIGDSEWRGMDA